MTSIVSGAIMYTVLVANTVALMTDADLTSKAYKNKVRKKCGIKRYKYFIHK